MSCQKVVVLEGSLRVASQHLQFLPAEYEGAIRLDLIASENHRLAGSVALWTSSAVGGRA
jgi:hypothetical protein